VQFEESGTPSFPASSRRPAFSPAGRGISPAHTAVRVKLHRYLEATEVRHALLDGVSYSREIYCQMHCHMPHAALVASCTFVFRDALAVVCFSLPQLCSSQQHVGNFFQLRSYFRRKFRRKLGRNRFIRPYGFRDHPHRHPIFFFTLSSRIGRRPRTSPSPRLNQ
jgi:hypothetical protein